MTVEARAAELWRALGGAPRALERLGFEGAGVLPSVFPVGDLAAASVGVAGLAASELAGAGAAVVVDRRLAGLWFKESLTPLGWELPPIWDAVAGVYAASDGWIRLHTNAPHHRAAALRVLDAPCDKGAVAARTRGWRADALETAVVEAGGAVAEMRSLAAWDAHPQGAAVAREALIAVETHEADARAPGAPTPDRPLRGVRALDLTRIIAGPAAARFLAGLGADVLRIDPPDWEEPSAEPEMTLGKRCARLDLRSAAGRARLAELLAGADVLLHGYRPGALDALGFDAETRRRLNPGLVEAALCAYGWTGPWAERRGFDSLVQMSCGIADEGARRAGVETPTPLPAQALDHATGYLMAASALRGLAERRDGKASTARLSLARTARFLVDAPRPAAPEDADGPREEDYAAEIERTAWGPARRLRPPVRIDGAPLAWTRPAGPLGATPDAAWRD